MSKSKGRRKWLLKKIIAVQNTYQTWKIHEGVADRWIYESHIGPVFFIGYGTMKRYLEIPAKKELKTLENSSNAESCEQSV